MPDRDGILRRQCLCRMVPATSTQSGAIAILQLVGEVEAVLKSLTGVVDWPLGRARLVRFDDIDEGLAVRLSHDLAQLMPHGGPRILQRLTERMIRQMTAASTATRRQLVMGHRGASGGATIAGMTSGRRFTHLAFREPRARFRRAFPGARAHSRAWAGVPASPASRDARAR